MRGAEVIVGRKLERVGSVVLISEANAKGEYHHIEVLNLGPAHALVTSASITATPLPHNVYIGLETEGTKIDLGVAEVLEPGRRHELMSADAISALHEALGVSVSTDQVAVEASAKLVVDVEAADAGGSLIKRCRLLLRPGLSILADSEGQRVRSGLDR